MVKHCTEYVIKWEKFNKQLAFFLVFGYVSALSVKHCDFKSFFGLNFYKFSGPSLTPFLKNFTGKTPRQQPCISSRTESSYQWWIQKSS